MAAEVSESNAVITAMKAPHSCMLFSRLAVKASGLESEVAQLKDSAVALQVGLAWKGDLRGAVMGPAPPSGCQSSKRSHSTKQADLEAARSGKLEAEKELSLQRATLRQRAQAYQAEVARLQSQASDPVSHPCLKALIKPRSGKYLNIHPYLGSSLSPSHFEFPVD